MLRRILTAAVLIPVVVLLILYGPELLVVAAAIVVVLLAQHEFFALASRMGLPAYPSWTMLCTVGLVYTQWAQGLQATRIISADVELIRHAAGSFATPELAFSIFLFGAALIAVLSRQPLADILPAAGVSSAALIFIAFPFSYLLKIFEIPVTGRKWVLFTLVLVWAGDMLAYFVGKSFGHMRMAPALSPKKTWEGAAANLAASLIVAIFFARWLGTDGFSLFIIAGLANMAGQLGDLLESGYKRGAGSKDSGGLLPGHGGMLDRIDSLILAAPVVWWALLWLLPSAS
jgi:phosphatidate cytidylyltransferase